MLIENNKIFKLSEEFIFQLLLAIDNNDLAILLKYSSDDSFSNKIFSYMSQIAVKITKNDIEQLKDIKEEKILEVEKKIVMIIDHLEKYGTIPYDKPKPKTNKILDYFKRRKIIFRFWKFGNS